MAVFPYGVWGQTLPEPRCWEPQNWISWGKEGSLKPTAHRELLASTADSFHTTCFWIRTHFGERLPSPFGKKV